MAGEATDDAPPPRRPGSVVRTAAHLVSSTAITSLLGIVFWAAAARWYTPSEVGVANAALAAATLLATAAQLSLGSVFNRYLARAGRHTNWILRRTYAVVSVLAIALALVAIGALSGTEFVEGPVAAITFVIAVWALALFVIQDSALLGLGKSNIVPIENALFAIGKIILLPLCIGLSVVSGIFAAWIAAAVASVVAVSGYVLLRAGPRRSAAPNGVPLPPRRTLYRQIIAQFATLFAGQAGVMVVPLIVIGTLGAAQNGYLTVPWLVSSSFGALFMNVVSSFTYHVRRGDPVTPASFARFVGMLAGLGVGGGVVVTVAAPLVVTILAPGYEAFATDLMRLVGVSVPFAAFFMIPTTFWWLENRMFLVAAAYALRAALVIAITWILLPSADLAAAGVALVIANVVVAAAMAPTLRRRLRMIRRGEGSRWVSADESSEI